MRHVMLLPNICDFEGWSFHEEYLPNLLKPFVSPQLEDANVA